jgi:putative transposase
VARPLRLEFAGAFYHLTARGNARAKIFLDDGDRGLFLALLSKEITQQGWRCYAFCLMGDHYHLLIETPEANLVSGMRRLNGVYTQAFNRRHGRVGHVFQGRYKAILVDKDSYAQELCRYIVLNPVRAGIVKRPQDWRWSSYRATAGQSAAPIWLDADWVLRQFGHATRRAQQAYRRFVNAGIGQASPWVHLRGQIWLGEKEFLERMEKLAQGKAVSNVPKAQQRPLRLNAAEIQSKVKHAYRIDEARLSRRENQLAFKAWAYLLRRAANLPLSEVAKRCGVSVSRISHIQRAIETSPVDATLKRLIVECKVKN